MGDGRNSRRALLKAGIASVALASASGCSGLFRGRNYSVRYEQGAAPGVVVTDAPESDGPLLYATTITSRSEMDERLDWGAAYPLDTVSSLEDSDFAEISFEASFLVILVSAFEFHRINESGEFLPLEFHGDTCLFPITLESLPPLSSTDEDGNPNTYFTHISAWDRTWRSVPERAEVEIRLEPSPQ